MLFALLCSDLSFNQEIQRPFIWLSSYLGKVNRTDVFKRTKFYLPEDGIYCAAQEAFSRFRRQEFRSEDCHELVEIDLSITWHDKERLIENDASPMVMSNQI